MAAIASPGRIIGQSSIASTDSETESFDLVGLLVDTSEDEEDDQDPEREDPKRFKVRNGDAAHDASALPASATSRGHKTDTSETGRCARA
jgi:hypothetical protein